MASLLSSHLDQISLCGRSIAELSFAGSRIFTNALLSQHDITALIRDTEAHERALFHLAPPPLPPKAGIIDFSTAGSSSSVAPASSSARRATVYGGARQPKNRAVAAVLGGDLYQRTRKDGPAAAARQKGDVDVDVLLEGAEKLAAVYPVPGAAERIARLRRRYLQLSANIAHYEAKVQQQSRDLDRLSSRSGFEDGEDEDDEEAAEGEPTVTMTAMPALTKEDLAREEAEIRDLEQKKKGLEERVTDMERDLGGLMR